MSSFDKLVAQWVTREDSTVPPAKKAEILNSVSASIDVYREIKDPAKAAKKKQQQEAAAADGAPRAITADKTAKKTKKKKTTVGKKRHVSKSVGGTPRAGVSARPGASARRSSTPAVPQTARGGRLSIDTSIIDFRFSKTVKDALRNVDDELEHERAASRGASEPAPQDPAADQPGTASDGGSATRARSRPTMTLSTEQLEQDTEAVLPYESPDDDVVVAAEEGTPATHTPRDPDTTLPLEQDPSEVEARVQFETGVMSTFRFGDSGGNDAMSEDSHLDDGCGAESEETAPIADDEDERRRQIQSKRPSRMGISDVSISLEEARLANFPETPKSRDKVKVITRTLERHFLFSYLDDSDLSKIASIMDVESFEAGEEIIAKGALSDTLFLVLSGEAETTMINEYGQEEVVPLSRGTTFGDLGLMYASKSEMSVVAKSHLECASLERRTYKLITSRTMADRRNRYAEFLKAIPEFRSLNDAEIRRLAEALKQSTYEKGQKLIAYGTPSNWLYFVVEGALEVIGRDADGQPRHLTTLREGDYAGHLEFLSRHVCVADVVAGSDVVRTAKLSRRMFDSLVGTARDVMNQRVEEGEEYQYYRTCMSETPPERDLSPAFDEPPLYLKGTLRDQDALNAALLAANGDADAEPNSEPATVTVKTAATAMGTPECEELVPPKERRNTAAPDDD